MTPFDRAVEALADRMTRGGYTLDRGEAEELVRAITLHGVHLDAAEPGANYYDCRCEADSDAQQGVRCNLHASTDLQAEFERLGRYETVLGDIAGGKRSPRVLAREVLAEMRAPAHGQEGVVNRNGPTDQAIERFEKARKVLDSGDHDEPFHGFFPAVIEVLELAQRRIRRDPDDPLIDYALLVADAVTEDCL